MNLLHVRAGGMLDEGLPVRMGVFTAAMGVAALTLHLIHRPAAPAWSQPWARRH